MSKRREFKSKKMTTISKRMFFVPNDTRKIITNLECENYALKLNKFPFSKVQPPKFVFDDIQFKFNEDMLLNIRARFENSVHDYHIVVKNVFYKTSWRLIIGLGITSVYETSMTLHHIYGIPFLPGSSIKGTIRGYVIKNYFSKNEMIAFEDPGFCDIFGYSSSNETSAQGKVMFFDANPTKVPELKLDIMNPLYTEKYSDSLNSILPTDYQNPIPIQFLTIQNTTFEFMIGMAKNQSSTIEKGKFSGKNLLDLTVMWLNESLTDMGIGAKRAVGYGYMKKIKDN